MLEYDYYCTCVRVDGARCRRVIPIMDPESTILGLARGRRMTIVRVMVPAIIAGGRGHPEVRRTRVEVDQEVGWGRPNADYTSPLRVVPDVHERLALAAIKVARCLLEGRDGGNVLGETASVLLEIDECLTVLAAA